MPLPQSFTSVRSYFFRLHIAYIDYAYQQYGGRSLDHYELADFRRLWSVATSQAINWRHAITNRYDPETKSWDRPFRRFPNERR